MRPGSLDRFLAIMGHLYASESAAAALNGGTTEIPGQWFALAVAVEAVIPKRRLTYRLFWCSDYLYVALIDPVVYLSVKC